MWNQPINFIKVTNWDLIKNKSSKLDINQLKFTMPLKHRAAVYQPIRTKKIM